MAPLGRRRSNLVPDWSRQSEELADLRLATEAAGRDRVGLRTGFGVNVLHGGETWPILPNCKMTFPSRRQSPMAGSLWTRSSALRSCVVAHVVRLITRRRTARSWRWQARYWTRSPIFFKHWPRRFWM